jgi:D-amino-acid dehydrogenase
MKFDNIVLGAGIIGVSIALHLQMRGLATALVDRRPPGQETSYGNAGLIERAGILPQPFPRDLRMILRYALNNRADMHYHPAALPGLVRFLAQYWACSADQAYRRIVTLRAPLIEKSIEEHEVLIERAGADELIVRDGCFHLYRDAAGFDAASGLVDRLRREYGLTLDILDRAAMTQREPGLRAPFRGAIHRRDAWSIRDPGLLVAKYASLFESLGGTVLQADALALEPGHSARGWRLPSPGGALEARNAVIALGPWSADLTRRLGYRLPIGVKRGYHMQYAQPDEEPLRAWIMDATHGYYVAPMQGAIRLTTGVEFARRDAPATPVQLGRAEPRARELFPGLGPRTLAGPWLGARPVTPDMMPVIGPAPSHAGLWFAFGHSHHGMTLGPVTGRLLAEMIRGERPFIDPAPYSATRFS